MSDSLVFQGTVTGIRRLYRVVRSKEEAAKKANDLRNAVLRSPVQREEWHVYFVDEDGCEYHETLPYDPGFRIGDHITVESKVHGVPMPPMTWRQVGGERL